MHALRHGARRWDMPSTTTFRRGADFRAYVQHSLAAKGKVRAADETRTPKGRAGLSGRRSIAAIGEALRRWFARELASFRAHLATATLRVRRFRRMSAAAEPPPAGSPEPRPAEPNLRARCAQAGPRARNDDEAKGSFKRPAGFDEQRREIEAVQARLDRVADPAAAPGKWAADLAREYRRDFQSLAAASKPPPPAAPTEKRTVADGAAAAVFFVGRAAWRTGRFLQPVFRFALAHSAPVLKLAAIALAIVGAAGFLAQGPQPEPDLDATAPIAPPPASRPRVVWIDLAKPSRIYDLSAPQLAREKRAYVARRHATGGGREDVLTFGEFAGKSPFLRLSVYRHGSEKSADAPFFVDMARRAAPLGLGLGRATFTQNQATRFGDFESAALTMAEGRVTRDNCRGFRLSAADPGLTIAGFACAAGDEPLSASDLACLVNRLDLLAAGDDRALRDFFAAAQARGGRGCPEASLAKKR